jgi:hypothetical protein
MTSDKKQTPENRLIRGMKEALMIAKQEYGKENNPPSLDRIRSMLRETARDDKVNAYDVLRAWHWNKICNSAAHGVLYHHAVTYPDYDWLNEPSPSGDDIHAWIEAYLAYWEAGLLDPEKAKARDLEFWDLNIKNMAKVDKQQWLDDMTEMRQNHVNAALHVTPDEVINVITLSKEWGFTPYHER